MTNTDHTHTSDNDRPEERVTVPDENKEQDNFTWIDEPDLLDDEKPYSVAGLVLHPV